QIRCAQLVGDICPAANSATDYESYSLRCMANNSPAGQHSHCPSFHKFLSWVRPLKTFAPSHCPKRLVNLLRRGSLLLKIISHGGGGLSVLHQPLRQVQVPVIFSGITRH